MSDSCQASRLVLKPLFRGDSREINVLLEESKPLGRELVARSLGRELSRRRTCIHVDSERLIGVERIMEVGKAAATSDAFEAGVRSHRASLAGSRWGCRNPASRFCPLRDPFSRIWTWGPKSMCVRTGGMGLNTVRSQYTLAREH